MIEPLLDEPDPRTAAWWRDALCAQVGVDLFYPPDEEPNASQAAAIRVCSMCPVRDPCLADALTVGSQDQYGIRAGTTALQRIAMIRKRDRHLWTSRRPTYMPPLPPSP